MTFEQYDACYALVALFTLTPFKYRRPQEMLQRQLTRK